LSQFCAINLFYSLGGRKNLWKNEKNAIKNVQKCVGAILNKNVQNEEKKQKFCSFENKMRIVLDNLNGWIRIERGMGNLFFGGSSHLGRGFLKNKLTEPSLKIGWLM
jgi:hypothetical protein